MEPPAHPADPADPSDPGHPAEARAKQPGKWALVRSLNQALKTYAVLPVRPRPGRGEGAPRALASGPRFPRLSAAKQVAGSQSPRVLSEDPAFAARSSLTRPVNLAPSAPPQARSWCSRKLEVGGSAPGRGFPAFALGLGQGAPPSAPRGSVWGPAEERPQSLASGRCLAQGRAWQVSLDRLCHL